jgi:hypothetical protein
MNNDSCCICRESYYNGHKLSAPQCGHVYHKKCLNRWFVESNDRKCPTCRAIISNNVSTLFMKTSIPKAQQNDQTLRTQTVKEQTRKDKQLMKDVKRNYNTILTNNREQEQERIRQQRLIHISRNQNIRQVESQANESRYLANTIVNKLVNLLKFMFCCCFNWCKQCPKLFLISLAIFLLVSIIFTLVHLYKWVFHKN